METMNHVHSPNSQPCGGHAVVPQRSSASKPLKKITPWHFYGSRIPTRNCPKKTKGIAKSLLCLKNLCAETFLVGATQEKFRIVPLHCCCTWQGFLADLALLELSLKNGCPHPILVSWRIIWGMTRISFSTQTKTVAVASNLAFLPFGGIAIRFSQH